MTLWLREIETDLIWKDEWPFLGRARFISSGAFEILKRELERYVRGEISGRSFNIAGHRGAGKTALVLRAVDQVRREIIERGIEPSAPTVAKLTNRTLAPQRPLLVKLSGPALLRGELPNPAGGKVEPPPTPTATAGGAEGAEPPTPAASSESKPMRTTALHGALVNLTIALYRALASEISTSYAIHAREEYRERPGDWSELAGQLTLELDTGPDPAVLRGFWQRIGRLDTGILWPRKVGKALVDQGLKDQGAREIVAVATAAQAFQVCSGAVTYSKMDKDFAQSEASVTGKGSADLKEATNKLLGLSGGALVGLAAYGADLGFTAAAAAAIVTGLLGAFTLSWSGSRLIRNDRTVAYTFIRDRSTQTLERDLPEVIQRIREAGLAPVFVIDELDKIDKLHEVVQPLIDRLKHMTSDNGFFCFLTDRSYYDHLRQALQSKAYPKEHTYFSHLLFVSYRPAEINDYLRDVFDSDAPPSSPDGADVADKFARELLCRLVSLRSNLNTVDVVRELARLSGPGGRVEMDSGELRSMPNVWLAATMQLAIELVLGAPVVATRMADNSQFAQLAIDAIYMIPRRWAAEIHEIRVGREDIVLYLLKRLGIDPPPKDQNEQEKALNVDIDPIVDAVARLAGFLTDLDSLRDELEKQRPAGAEFGLLDAIPSGGSDGKAFRLLEQQEEPGVYRFLYDVYGRELQLRKKSALAQVADEIRELDVFVEELALISNELDVSVPDLVAVGILPQTITWSEILLARDRLRAAVAAGQHYDRLAADLPVLQNLSKAIKQRGPALALITRIAMRTAFAAKQGKEPLPLLSAFSALARYVDFEKLFPRRRRGIESATRVLREFLHLDDEALQVTSIPDDTAKSIKEWGVELIEESDAARPSMDLPAAETAAWREWSDHVMAYVIAVRSHAPAAGSASIGSETLALAAAGLLPGSRFHRDLGRLSVADWSAICLAGFRASGQQMAAPRWAVVAGLAALGFGKSVLTDVVNAAESEIPSPPPTGAERASIERLLESVPEGRPGGLYIMLDSGSLAENPGVDADRPVFALRRHHLAEYDAAIAWLKRRKALTQREYDENAPDSQETAQR